MTANTTASPARTSVERSKRIARDYGTSCQAVCRCCARGSGRRGEVGALDVLEDPRPLDGLCKDDVGSRLARTREERLAVAGDHHDAGGAARSRAKLAD